MAIKTVNFQANEAGFISRILGNEELPVRKVFLKNVLVKSIGDENYIHQNVTNFK
ncbi:MAG: hypothetical protein ACK5M7_00995 [Draconibacterium sp.]